MAKNNCVPKKFLCRYSLSYGVTSFAIIFACVKILCIVVLALQMLSFSKCESCTRAVLRCAYGFCGAFIITCLIMLVIHLWYLWPKNRLRSSMVVVWVAATAIWLAQTFCLTLVLLCLYMDDVSLTVWVLCFIFGILAFVIAAYGVLVGYALWQDIKRERQQGQQTTN